MKMIMVLLTVFALTCATAMAGTPNAQFGAKHAKCHCGQMVKKGHGKMMGMRHAKKGGHALNKAAHAGFKGQAKAAHGRRALNK
jgi:hypothetical protein